MMEPLKIYWARLNNWGDKLAPVIVKALSGREIVHSAAPGKIVTVGSVLEHATDGDIIWGTGSMFEKPARVSNMQYHAVRGPLTRKIVLNAGYSCPEVYGDPAILMPYIYKVSKQIDCKIGIIPHYVDKKLVEHLRGVHKDVRILDIQGDITEVMNEVARCKVVLSSSLHGVIIAEALGRKACYVQMSNGVVGGDFKFKDYYASTGRQLVKIDWRQGIHGITIPHPLLSEAVNKAISSPDPKFDHDKLLRACPFNFRGYQRAVDIPSTQI